jgi:hypothetical protein
VNDGSADGLQYKAPRLTGSGQKQQTLRQIWKATAGAAAPRQMSAAELLAVAQLQNEELANRVKVTPTDTLDNMAG